MSLVIAGLSDSALAQTRSETKQYGKAMSKPSLKAYNNFLKKYPESVYAPEIIHGRDSILFAALDKNDQKAVETFLAEVQDRRIASAAEELLRQMTTTSVTQEEACAILIANAGFPLADRPATAVACRSYGHDYVFGAVLPEKGGRKIDFLVLKQEDGWKVEQSFSRTADIMTDGLSPLFFTEPSSFAVFGEKRYLQISYVSGAKGSRWLEYSVALVDFQTENMSDALFYGRSLSKGDVMPDAASYRIEGQNPGELAAGSGMTTAEDRYLAGLIKANDRLVPIAQADALTDEAIQWWLGRNRKAESASSAAFGTLSEECGIVQVFKKQEKESSRNYSAALFDLRGYTVVCAWSKSQKHYMLVWCEPVARNKNTDKLLNSIYFENDNTLCLYYYQGRKTFKKRVNLATKSIR